MKHSRVKWNFQGNFHNRHVCHYHCNNEMKWTLILLHVKTSVSNALMKMFNKPCKRNRFRQCTCMFYHFFPAKYTKRFLNLRIGLKVVIYKNAIYVKNVTWLIFIPNQIVIHYHCIINNKITYMSIFILLAKLIW